MHAVKKVANALVLVLIAGIVSLCLAGCMSTDEHPSGDHSDTEHPASEHPE